VLAADVGHLTCAKATDVISADTSNAATAKATDVSSTEPAHVASTESAAVSATATAATATAGLRTRGKQAAGQYGGCQNHHHSSSHDILHWDGRTFPPQDWSDIGVCLSRQTPTSRWTGDGNTGLSPLLNSRSVS
jgi:hypothetical protein